MLLVISLLLAANDRPSRDTKNRNNNEPGYQQNHVPRELLSNQSETGLPIKDFEMSDKIPAASVNISLPVSMSASMARRSENSPSAKQTHGSTLTFGLLTYILGSLRHHRDVTMMDVDGERIRNYTVNMDGINGATSQSDISNNRSHTSKDSAEYGNEIISITRLTTHLVNTRHHTRHRTRDRSGTEGVLGGGVLDRRIDNHPLPLDHKSTASLTAVRHDSLASSQVARRDKSVASPGTDDPQQSPQRRVSENQSIISRCVFIGSDFIRWRCWPIGSNASSGSSNRKMTSRRDNKNSHKTSNEDTHDKQKEQHIGQTSRDGAVPVHDLHEGHQVHARVNNDTGANYGDKYLLGNNNASVVDSSVEKSIIFRSNIRNNLQTSSDRKKRDVTLRNATGNDVRDSRVVNDTKNGSFNAMNATELSGNLSTTEAVHRMNGYKTGTTTAQESYHQSNPNNSSDYDNEISAEIQAINTSQHYNVQTYIGKHRQHNSAEIDSESISAPLLLRKVSDNDLSRAEESEETSIDISSALSNNISKPFNNKTSNEEHLGANGTNHLNSTEKEQLLGDKSGNLLPTKVTSNGGSVQVDSPNVTSDGQQEITSLNDTIVGNVSRQMLRSSMLVKDMAVIEGI